MSDYTRKDFVSNNEVKWCPGCGDYAILAALQKALPEMGRAPEDHVFVSGIGCAGRLPYYLETFGFHTIHGRAPAVATGIKMMAPDLSVWVITGDGDGLSIGANHLLHCLRRNVNVTVLLLNNQVYGLTKGQFSPTSKPGQVTKTSPQGVSDRAINPLSFALTSGATFVARCVDKDPKAMAELFIKAHAHSGVSFIEIYQNCPIFNDGPFNAFSEKGLRAEKTLSLADKQPMLFGKDDHLGLALDSDGFSVSSAASATLHDVSNKSRAMRLAELDDGAMPVLLGVFYQVGAPTYSPNPKTILKSKAQLQALLDA